MNCSRDNGVKEVNITGFTIVKTGGILLKTVGGVWGLFRATLIVSHRIMRFFPTIFQT